MVGGLVLQKCLVSESRWFVMILLMQIMQWSQKSDSALDLVWITASCSNTGTAWQWRDLETELLPHCGTIQRGDGNPTTIFAVRIFQAHAKGVDHTTAMNFLSLCVGEVLRAWFVLSVPSSCDALYVCTDLRQPRPAACSAFSPFH